MNIMEEKVGVTFKDRCPRKSVRGKIAMELATMRNHCGVTYMTQSTLSPQSGTEQISEVQTHAQANESYAPDQSASTITQFDDNNPGVDVAFDPVSDSTFFTNYVDEAELGKFLSRPVLISTYTWNIGVHLSQSFDPWTLLFNNVAFKKKIDNYYLFNGSLKIKIMMNASPFYYGALLASYRPHLATGPSVANGAGRQELIPYSQMPHIWMYPQGNQGGTIEAPYFAPSDYIDITSSSIVASMGRVYLNSATILRNANGLTTTGITIQVYAWAENVKLSGPTLKLALQAGDEYETDGMISGPASAVSSAASILSSVPIIGKYASAASKIAGGVAKVAKFFGFSNTAVVSSVMPFKNLPFHAFASPEISAPIEKLTLDTKNELTIDPRSVGLSGDDDMLIKNFIQRESYLAEFTWASEKVADDWLWGMAVTPNYFATDTILTSVPVLYQTPVGHLARLFRFWKGDINIRFRFICSKYHRGRVRISYDPVGNLASTATTTNVAFTRVFDLAKDPDVVITVPYMQSFPWSNCYTGNVTPTLYGSGANNYNQPGFSNGSLSVRVFTATSAPIASADISVIVSVWAGSNFEFGNPMEAPTNITPLVPQAGIEELDTESTYDKPLNVAIPGSGAYNPNMFAVNMGEKIVSLRQLFKRTQAYLTLYPLPPGANDTVVYTQFVIPRRPVTYGYDNASSVLGPKISDGSLTGVNYCPTTWFSYMQNCFMAQRGAWNYHVNTESEQEISCIEIGRYWGNQTNYTGQRNTISTTTTYTRYAYPRLVKQSGGTGLSLCNQHTQVGQSISAPMYVASRYLNTVPSNTISGSTDEVNDRLCINLVQRFKTQGVYANTPVALSLYYHAGNDLSLIWFLCVPTLYVYNIPTPSS